MPFILIYLFNWIIFAIIIVSLLYKNWYKLAPRHTSQSQKSGVSTRQQFMIAVTLSVLFGIGWGIGLLATEKIGNRAARNFFASMFVIITGFHGLLIFILHCARSQEARKEWRRWFLKITRKEFSDFTSSTSVYIQHNLKTSSIQPLSPSSSSKTTKQFELPASEVSPFFSMSDDGETLKQNMMKSHESDTLCNLQSMEEGVYERATESKLDTDFTKVDLANVEGKQVNTSNVKSNANSSGQVADVFQEGHCSVTITPSNPDDDKPMTDQSCFHSITEEATSQEVQQDDKHCPEEATPSKLKEQRYTKVETSATKIALEKIISMPPAVENDTVDHSSESKA